MKAQRCPECTQLHGGFHLCHKDLNPNFIEAHPRSARKSTRNRGLSESHRENMSEAIRLLWERRHEATRERDLRVCAVYSDGLSLVKTGEQFGLNRGQVKTILMRMGTDIRPSNSEKNRVR